MPKLSVSLDAKSLKELQALAKKAFPKNKKAVEKAVLEAVTEWMQREATVQGQKEIQKDPPF